MTTEIKLWKIQSDTLTAVNQSELNLEARLENWLEQDISLISDNLLVIGRQVETEFGGKIDLLCLDERGDIVIVELKRDRTPRDITAQVLDYASWVKDLSNERITDIAEIYLNKQGKGSLEEAFQDKFDTELPDILNESHSMLIVATQVDSATERIVKYLSDSYGVDINAITFQYFKEDSGHEYIARTFLIQPSQVEYKSQQARSTSKRRPNLSLDDLQAIADEKGVGELYTQFFDALSRYFNKSTTRSSVAFYGNINGNRRTVFSLIPPESNSEDGLRFQLYLSRLTRYFNITEDKILAILPEQREDWEYYPGAGEEWAGYTGYFQNEEEVAKFIDGLRSFRRTGLNLQEHA